MTLSGTYVAPGQAPIEFYGDVWQRLSKEPWESSPVPPAVCSERFSAPRPRVATDLNGAIFPPVCFKRSSGPHHVFLIGDWGGISQMEGMIPRPADHRSKKFKTRHRKFVLGADNCAQVSVAVQMEKRALEKRPDYILNVGDNFYWGGVEGACGATPVAQASDLSGQWDRVFERVYGGPGLAGRQWLGVLGNHDYGGYHFSSAWDQAIAYTWVTGGKATGRWFTPALYWGQQVQYSDFTIDYFFVDSNLFDAFNPLSPSTHNMCSAQTNPKNATCGAMGPMTIMDCPEWFQRTWDAQMIWLEKGLSKSNVDWQIVVTHFPPEFGENDWRRLTYAHGIDLLITGHRHQQEVHYFPDSNFLYPTAYLVSGGGGGITSEATPDADGNDDQYGFMDLTLAKEEIMVEAFSHAGGLRSRTCVTKRAQRGVDPLPISGRSMCEGLEKGPLPAPPKKGGRLGPSVEIWA